MKKNHTLVEACDNNLRLPEKVLKRFIVHTFFLEIFFYRSCIIGYLCTHCLQKPCRHLSARTETDKPDFKSCNLLWSLPPERPVISMENPHQGIADELCDPFVPIVPDPIDLHPMILGIFDIHVGTFL